MLTNEAKSELRRRGLSSVRVEKEWLGKKDAKKMLLDLRMLGMTDQDIEDFLDAVIVDFANKARVMPRKRAWQGFTFRAYHTEYHMEGLFMSLLTKSVGIQMEALRLGKSNADGR
jgi:hypothetical protein